MEPLDTDLEYGSNEPRPATRASRMNTLLIFPILGVLIILTFISAAIFQWNISDLIDILVGLLLVFFIAFIVMIFWAFAPSADQA